MVQETEHLKLARAARAAREARLEAERVAAVSELEVVSCTHCGLGMKWVVTRAGTLRLGYYCPGCFHSYIRYEWKQEYSKEGESFGAPYGDGLQANYAQVWRPTAARPCKNQHALRWVLEQK